MSRILLINFSSEEAKKFEELPITVDRGYVSEIRKGDEQKLDAFYFPHSIFEYQTIIIRTGDYEGLHDEFSDRRKEYNKEERIPQFHKYISGHGKVIFVLGNYKYKNLDNFGVFGLNIHENNDHDINTISSIAEINNFGKILSSHKNEVVMPTMKYLTVEDKPYEYGKIYYNHTAPSIYKNAGGRILSLYQNHGARYESNKENPGFIILPEFHNTSLVLTKVVKEIAQLNPNLLPELYTPSWKESDEYYPSSIEKYDDKIKEEEIRSQATIQKLESKKEEEKKKYHQLIKLLTETGDNLKDAVKHVLETYFNLEVIDVDAKNTSAISDEDLIIKHSDRTILVEVKGDKSSYPKQKHVTQVWKHLSRSDNIEEGALILNHDWDTEPEKRQDAYTGEDRDAIEDIIFIDTRELYKLSVAITESKLTSSEAINTLLKPGRVIYKPERKTEKEDKKEQR